MKLSAKTDYDIPADFLYAALTDYPHWEREGVRRGADVTRPEGPQTGEGAAWHISGRYRGKQRQMLLRTARLVPGQLIAYTFDSPTAEGSIQMEITSLSARRSRLRLVIDAKPKTLAARLFVNTLRLAKGRVEGKLESRLVALGRQLKIRHERSQTQSQA